MPPELGPNPGSKESLPKSALFATLENAFMAHREFINPNANDPQTEVLSMRYIVESKKVEGLMGTVTDYSIIRPVDFASLNGQAHFIVKLETNSVPQQERTKRGKKRLKKDVRREEVQELEYLIEQQGAFKRLQNYGEIGEDGRFPRIALDNDAQAALTKVIASSTPLYLQTQNHSAVNGLARAS